MPPELLTQSREHDQQWCQPPDIQAYRRKKPPEDDSHLQTLCEKLIELSELLGGEDRLVKEALDVKELINMHTEFVTTVRNDNVTRGTSCLPNSSSGLTQLIL
jgi:hypothetical protein